MTEARRFDWLIGSWQGEETRPQAEGKGAVGLQVYPILGGCAMMDFTEIVRNSGTWKGFRIRAWDAGSKEWVQYSIDDRRPVFVRSEGSGDATRFTTTGEEAGARQIRETWSHVSLTEAVWSTEESTDGGKRWELHQEMKLIRRP